MNSSPAGGDADNRCRQLTVPGQPPLQLPGPRTRGCAGVDRYKSVNDPRPATSSVAWTEDRTSECRDVAADPVLELVVGGVGRSLVLGNTTCLRSGGEIQSTRGRQLGRYQILSRQKILKLFGLFDRERAADDDGGDISDSVNCSGDALCPRLCIGGAVDETFVHGVMTADSHP